MSRPGVQTFPHALLECLSAGLHDKQSKKELTARDLKPLLPLLSPGGSQTPGCKGTHVRDRPPGRGTESSHPQQAPACPEREGPTEQGRKPEPHAKPSDACNLSHHLLFKLLFILLHWVLAACGI